MISEQSKPVLIGLSGSFASGKDAIAELLVERAGYTHASSSVAVRAAATQGGVDGDRALLRPFANEMRVKHGAEYFTKLAYEQALSSEAKKIVISGLRATSEAAFIKQYNGFVVFVDAPIELRFERTKQRNRDIHESQSFEVFKQNELKESYSTSGKNEQNIYSIRKNADIELINDCSFDELWRRLELLLPSKYLAWIWKDFHRIMQLWLGTKKALIFVRG